MSIRGIDAQMMVTRATDLLQSANTQLKGAERAQENLAVQNQNAAERDRSSVAKADKSPVVELRTGDEGGGDAYMSQQNDGQKKDEYNEMLDSELGSSEHILDIIL